LGIYLSSVYLGLSLGPFLGGILTHHFGWRSIFLINVPLGLIVIVLGLGLKGEWVGAKGEKFDLIGSIVLSVALIAMMYGFSTLPSLNGVYLIIVGIIGIFLFVGIESKVKNPVFNIKIFKNNRMFTLSSVVSLINYSATFAVAFLLSLYLQYIKGLTPQSAGLIIASQPIIMSISSPFTGRISDKVEPKIVVTIGMIIITLSLFFFTFLSKGTRLSLIIFDFIFFGIGFSLFASPNTNAIMSSVEKRFYGIASATVAIMRMIGQMLSMGIAMFLFTIYMGKARITPDQFPNFLKSMKIAFIIFTFLCLVDIFISLARGEVKKQE
ncbi:MAG: MFS transporter, partial [Deltaproteobacteria bacterium]|nr:MFS transporter [Deltaproteobacteria bacterium]